MYVIYVIYVRITISKGRGVQVDGAVDWEDLG